MIVGLETSVLAQGLPAPHNRAAARLMPEAIRAAGAEPAFVAIDRGRLVVGADDMVLDRLMSGSRKAARRDLPVFAATGEDGATTVSATIWAAHRAGIRVVATGGIGGVHPGGDDVSEDLTTLASTPLILVCSGAKSILDLPATLERLETLGVLVLGYQSDMFPAFYSRDSGLPVQQRVENPADVARIAAARDALGLSAAILVCVPPPAEAALPLAEIDAAVRQAEQVTTVRGSGRTPALLAALGEITGGRSLRTNLALLEQNARIAAAIALAGATAQEGDQFSGG